MVIGYAYVFAMLYALAQLGGGDSDVFSGGG